jgi:hypothetical protein
MTAAAGDLSEAARGRRNGAARIERNGTRFSSLLELDNFWAFNLKAFDEAM